MSYASIPPVRFLYGEIEGERMMERLDVKPHRSSPLLNRDGKPTKADAWKMTKMKSEIKSREHTLSRSGEKFGLHERSVM
jgi:hypothetical protein